MCQCKYQLIKTYQKYILEFFVIVFSVLAAFWLENWRQDRIEMKDTLLQLRTLETQLEDEIEILEGVLVSGQEAIARGEKAINIIQFNTMITTEERSALDSALWRVAFIDAIPNHPMIYDELISSGRLRKIDPDLQILLVNYLDRWDRTNNLIRNFQTSFLYPENTLSNILIREFGFERYKYEFDQIRGDSRVYQILDRSQRIKQTRIHHYSSVLEHALNVREKLEEVLREF